MSAFGRTLAALLARPLLRHAARGLAVGVVSLALPAVVQAAPWEDATAETIGDTEEWSNELELADLDGDGLVDMVFANGGNYSAAGDPEPNRIFMNAGPGEPFEALDLPGDPDLARSVKARDLNGDGWLDLVFACTYQTPSRLFWGGADGFEEASGVLPSSAHSFGDLEVGDVDEDGDLDLVLADWGEGSPLNNAGGPVRLWINEGGIFEDRTATQMPELAIGFSWDMELNDVDGDYDLDALISCKSCESSVLLRNDGAGHFEEDPGALPQATNNYEFELIDLDGDEDLDIATINDGPQLREMVWRNDGAGVFEDLTQQWWPAEDNLAGSDDNVVAFIDADNDGDADLMIGSLNASDRILINDGNGGLSLDQTIFGAPNTPGTLALALADLNEDGRPDVVQAQGELASPEQVLFATEELPVDTQAPMLQRVQSLVEADGVQVRAAVHDNHTPIAAHHFNAVELSWEIEGEPQSPVPMEHYGGLLWRGQLALDTTETGPDALVELCGEDRHGNRRCEELYRRGESGETGGTESGGSDAGEEAGGSESGDGPDSGSSSDEAGQGEDVASSGCACRIAGEERAPAPRGAYLLALLFGVAPRRRVPSTRIV